MFSQARAVIVAGEARAKSLAAVAEALGGAQVRIFASKFLFVEDFHHQLKWVRIQCFVEQGGQAASLAVAENYVKVSWAKDRLNLIRKTKAMCVFECYFLARHLESLQRRAIPYCCLPTLEMSLAWSLRWLNIWAGQSGCYPFQQILIKHCHCQTYRCLYLFMSSQAMSIYKKLEHTVPQPSLKPVEANEEGQ